MTLSDISMSTLGKLLIQPSRCPTWAGWLKSEQQVRSVSIVGITAVSSIRKHVLKDQSTYTGSPALAEPRRVSTPGIRFES